MKEIIASNMILFENVCSLLDVLYSCDNISYDNISYKCVIIHKKGGNKKRTVNSISLEKSQRNILTVRFRKKLQKINEYCKVIEFAEKLQNIARKMTEM